MRFSYSPFDSDNDTKCTNNGCGLQQGVDDIWPSDHTEWGKYTRVTMNKIVKWPLLCGCDNGAK